MRLRELAIPLATYVVITIVLPLANGAGARRDFAHHSVLVVVGCAAVVGIVALANKLRPRRVGARP